MASKQEFTPIELTLIKASIDGAVKKQTSRVKRYQKSGNALEEYYAQQIEGDLITLRQKVEGYLKPKTESK